MHLISISSVQIWNQISHLSWVPSNQFEQPSPPRGLTLKLSFVIKRKSVNMSDYALFRLTSNSSRLGLLLQKMYKLGDTAF